MTTYCEDIRMDHAVVSAVRESEDRGNDAPLELAERIITLHLSELAREWRENPA
jgi:hypothetical protein